MAMKRFRLFSIVLCGVMIVAGAVGGKTAATASAGAAAPIEEEGLRVSVGTFVVERGARLALEIVRSDPCVCLCDPVWVRAVTLLDGFGETIREEPLDTPVDAIEWLGQISLARGEGDEPLPEGAYTILVETSAGAFSASAEVVPTQQVARFGRFSASASVCGLELRVYRLITEDDAGGEITLRRGDRLMVALAGNATTGFAWENALLYEYAVLRETEEPEYRAKPHPLEMVGFGGTFLFRYEAVDTGPQSFRFVYRRPWESVEPEQVLEFAVAVY